MFHRYRNAHGVSPFSSAFKFRGRGTLFPRARVVSASYRRRVLASSHLAKGERLSQAFARRGDVSGATGKESRRLSAQVTGAGRLLATTHYRSAVTNGDGSHGSAHQTA